VSENGPGNDDEIVGLDGNDYSHDEKFETANVKTMPLVRQGHLKLLTGI